MSTHSRAGGLPSNPQRSRSTRDRSRLDEEDSYHRAPFLPCQVRPQKSTPSIRMQGGRSRPPPLPQARWASSCSNHPYDHLSDATSYHPSGQSSASSPAPSLFSRMKPTASYSSSLTSLDDEEQRSAGNPGHSLRTRRPMRSDAKVEPTYVLSQATSADTGDGATIWSRVATAASTLTVSVSKAWTTNVTTMSGEETPPGQESRLTRAMKAYHIEKARNPSDLPAWLFDEHERTPLPRYDRYEVAENPITELPRPKGLRDAYDTATVTASTPSNSERTRGPNYVDDVQPSKATDRLKALRDAKRSAVKPRTMMSANETGLDYRQPATRSQRGD
ncbi:uncharacterized protein BT62DRAFT_8720 [Guyanagaster necrorhizus]|uniref:Uncharacterized protein n=1 Tax=Guyanagaster necrorhizus TaxID=856835 RepID=A0A9P8AY58_9AGAR|nr:uncharacterized protein BT62DRAFT_8720 [Guyanagaster necrorhizus MCA 3950]KAG7452554.1 hypothetical protein BT62DRAFT_8720 [Guyanagaster necrorhizus MCA 3950]